jgi:hypothetical protein
MPDTILEGNHPQIILAEFGWDWLSSFRGEHILNISFPVFFLFLAWRSSWFKVGITGQNFGRGPCKDHSTKVWLQLVQWFLRRRFLWEFPIGSYVKLSSAVTAIFVGVLQCWTHFWKGTTQGSFQQSLVEIGSVVLEEKIFFKFHHPFFFILSLTDFLVGSRDHRTHFWKVEGDHPRTITPKFGCNWPSDFWEKD